MFLTNYALKPFFSKDFEILMALYQFTMASLKKLSLNAAGSQRAYSTESVRTYCAITVHI